MALVGVVVVGGCAHDPCERAAAYTDAGQRFERLQDAAIEDGQTLRVCPGTHEVEGWGPVSAFLRSEAGYPLFGGYAIVGAGTGPVTVEAVGDYSDVLELYPGRDVLVEGLVLRGGYAGPGEPCDDFCTGPRVCGGSTVWDGHITFRDVVFEDNSADFGAALCVGQGLWAPGTEERTPTVTLEGVTFRDNTATKAGGAVLLVGDAFVEATDTTWGTDDADNAPDDIAILPKVEDYAERMELLASYSFDGTVDVECDGAAAICR